MKFYFGNFNLTTRDNCNQFKFIIKLKRREAECDDPANECWRYAFNERQNWFLLIWIEWWVFYAEWHFTSEIVHIRMPAWAHGISPKIVSQFDWMRETDSKPKRMTSIIRRFSSFIRKIFGQIKTTTFVVNQAKETYILFWWVRKYFKLYTSNGLSIRSTKCIINKCIYSCLSVELSANEGKNVYKFFFIKWMVRCIHVHATKHKFILYLANR